MLCILYIINFSPGKVSGCEFNPKIEIDCIGLGTQACCESNCKTNCDSECKGDPRWRHPRDSLGKG